jgi:hypothetical protein
MAGLDPAIQSNPLWSIRIVIPAEAGIRPSIDVFLNSEPGQIPAFAGMTEIVEPFTDQ